MSSNNRLFRPELPEGRATHIQEGFTMGWVPGEITSMYDPEGIGRIKVRCDILAEDTTLPNNNDGYVWVLEPFTCNAVPGGSHTLLHEGSQVALIPMFGDPKQMLMIGCLPSRVDRPYIEFDRKKGTYGTATPGQVFTLKNDKDKSRIDAYPHGVLQQISNKGDITYQTAKNARLQLKSDATARIENDKAFTSLTPDGKVHSASASGAMSVLDSAGKVMLASSGLATLALDQSKAKIEGPASPLSSLLKDVQKTLNGSLGEVQKALQQIKKISGLFLKGEKEYGVLHEITTLLGTINKTLTENLPKGISIVESISKFDAKTLGNILLPQINTVLGSNLGGITTLAQELIGKKIEPEKIIDIIQKQFPNIKGLEKALPIIKQLGHNPNMQIQALLSEVVPFSDIQNMIGGGFIEKSNDIQSIFDKAKAIMEIDTKQKTLVNALNNKSTTPESLSSFLQKSFSSSSQNVDTDKMMQDYYANASFNISMDELLGKKSSEQLNTQAQVNQPQDNSLSSFLRNNFIDTEAKLKELGVDLESKLPKDHGMSKEKISEVLSKSHIYNPWEEVLGSKAKTSVNNAQAALASLSNNASPLSLVTDFANTLSGKGSGKAIEKIQAEILKALKDVFGIKLDDKGMVVDKILPMFAKALSDAISPLVKQATDNINKLTSILPSGIKGAIVEAGQTIAEMKTQLGSAGAIARVQSMSAEMIGPGGATSLFAGIQGAGIKTPWGEFNLGDAGGSLISQGKLAFQVLQDIGGTVGLSLNPKTGASLSSFFPETKTVNTVNNQSARIVTEGQSVKIECFNPGGQILHSVSVSPVGVFIDDINVSYLATLPNRLALLESRLSSIEASLITQPIIP